MTSEVNRRPLFEATENEEMWVEGQSRLQIQKSYHSLKCSGEKTFLVTPNEITPTRSNLFVQAPPERIATPTQARNRRFGVVFRWHWICTKCSSDYFLGALCFRIYQGSNRSYRINGTCIHAGDIVILAPTPRTQPQVGDIAAYTARRFSGEVVGIFTHRIIGGDPVNGFLMKGDNNPAPDVQRPKVEDINGVVFFVIPFIGKFLTLKMLMIFVPVGVGIWLPYSAMAADIPLLTWERGRQQQVVARSIRSR
jgi:hypothetical protein